MTVSYITPKMKEGETIDLSLYSPRERTNIRLYGIECKNWLPRDVAEYRQRWAANCEVVTVRGQLEQGKRWCREHLFMQDWDYRKYANPDDSHLFYFKNPEEAFLFKLSIDCI
jgi:hypothetical protein